MTTAISILLVAALATLLAAAAVGIAGALVVVARGRVAATEPAGVGTLRVAIPAGRLARLGTWTAATLLWVALVLRTIVAGHAPWSNLHEFSLAFAAVLLVSFGLLSRRQRLDALGPMAALLAAGLVAFGLSLDDRIDPLVPALQQPVLLTVHVGTAVLAYALAGVAFLAAAAEIGQRAASGRVAALPSAASLRELGHRAVLIAFPILTIAIALGSVWANLAWRSYWSNDPKELAAAATWLVFGAYLHVAGRRDRWEAIAPWLIVLGFAGVLFTYIGAGLIFVGEHSYGAP